MIFEHDGKTYTIEFERDYGQHAVLDKATGVRAFVKDTYPFTIVRVLVHNVFPDGTIKKEIFRTAKVGCWHHEREFTLEKGRLRALRMVTRTLSKAMKPKLWAAYHARATARPTAQLSLPIPEVVNHGTE